MARFAVATNLGRGLALATALAAGVAFTAIPRPAFAIDTGAAVGLGLGAFALGSVLGAASNPYYAYGYPYAYPYAYPPAYTYSYYGYAPGYIYGSSPYYRYYYQPW